MRDVILLTRMELKLFMREPMSVLFTIGFPLVVLVVLAGVFGSEAEQGVFFGIQPSDYYAAVYPAVVVGAVGLIAVPVQLASYRERGVLRRYQASGVPVQAVVVSQLLVGTIVAAAASAVLVAAAIIMYGSSLPRNPLATGVSFAVGTAAFLGIGLLLGATATNARAAQATGMLLFLPLWLLSGAGPPPDVMGEAMSSVAGVLPLTWVVKAVRTPWFGGGLSGLNLGLLVALLIGSVTVASARLSRG